MADIPPSNNSPLPFVDGLSVPRQSTIATAPFNKPHTDIILRTCDKVDFHVWKGILVEASPVLADMLTLGALASSESSTVPSSADDDSRTHVPIIDVPEPSSVLDPLLRTCYPPPHAVFATLEALKPVLAVAHKYQMDGVFDVLKEELLKHAPSLPMRVYLIALRFDMQDAARMAVRHILDHPRDEYAPELEDCCAGLYHRLLAYRKQCAKAVEDIFISKLSWLPDRGWHFLTCSLCAAESFSCTLRDSDVQRIPRAWFWKHYQLIRTVLAERPCRAALEDPTFQHRAIRDASACAHCRFVVQDSLPAFTVCLQDEIDNRLAEVVLPLL